MIKWKVVIKYFEDVIELLMFRWNCSYNKVILVVICLRGFLNFDYRLILEYVMIMKCFFKFIVKKFFSVLVDFFNFV